MTSVSSIYENREIEIILAYLRFSCRGQKRSDFYKIMNHPLRYIKRESVPDSIVSKSAILSYYRGNTDMIERISRLFMQLSILKRMRPVLCIRYILKEIGLEKEVLKGKTGLSLNNAENSLEKLMQEAASFDNNAAFLDFCTEQVRLAREERNKQKDGNNDGVRIMTLHASKGLEFENVFLPSLNEGIMPGRKSVTEAEIEEERRLMYVGMTRAKNRLYISYVTGDKENPRMPSRFIRPLQQYFDN
jgi:DNA helicase-2/ATP-dependent DNA helicase PcrA